MQPNPPFGNGPFRQENTSSGYPGGDGNTSSLGNAPTPGFIPGPPAGVGQPPNVPFPGGANPPNVGQNPPTQVMAPQFGGPQAPQAPQGFQQQPAPPQMAGQVPGGAPVGQGGGSQQSGNRAPAAYAVHLSKVYGSGDAQVHALRDINLAFQAEEFTAIMGPSGSGKSTLMHCMAGLDTATEGGAFVGDINLSRLTDKQTTSLRRDRLGFIFQSFNLVPTLTAAENITLPCDVAGRDIDDAWFQEVTTRLGLSDRLDHRPAELSGGQQQRVACARALVARPEIIFGDEPTGNLDSNSSREVLQILRNAVDAYHQTVVIVTHDPKAASYADRVVFLADGRIIAELRNPTSEAVLAMMARIEKRS